MTGHFPSRLKAGLLAVALAVSPAVVAGGWAGWLRLSGNVHEFDAGMFRSAQMSPDRLAGFVRAHGIRTVLNLRGANPGRAWYEDEARVVREAGAAYVSIGLSANHEPDPATVTRLVETLRTAPKPLLLHCEAGADRSGLASSLYELVVMHHAPAEADRQLSFRYGHFPWLASRSGAMDGAFATVASKRGGD